MVSERSSSATIEMLSNRLVASYLSSVGVAGHFARYVMRTSPETFSLAAVRDEQIVGAAVCGLDIGLFEASSCWIFADDVEACTPLLHHVHTIEFGSLNLPLHYGDLLAKVYPELKTSVDRLYVLTRSEFRPSPDTFTISSLTKELLSTLDLSEEMQPRIGRIDAIPESFPLYGVVQDNRLCALAETAVRDSHIVAIQQVFTLPANRRQGYARALVSHISRELLRQGLTPTYFVAEDNLPSIQLAESLGFTLESRWGCAE